MSFVAPALYGVSCTVSGDCCSVEDLHHAAALLPLSQGVFEFMNMLVTLKLSVVLLSIFLRPVCHFIIL